MSPNREVLWHKSLVVHRTCHIGEDKYDDKWDSSSKRSVSLQKEEEEEKCLLDQDQCSNSGQ